MERMPAHDDSVRVPAGAVLDRTISAQPPAAGRHSDWRTGLPVLTGSQVVLRELRASDAASLFTLLTTEEVARFISPPPSTVEGFERFIEWTLRQRTAGTYACFAVTLKGFNTAIGIFQVRETEPGFQTAEWGFAIGSAFWGTGVFEDGANLVLGFAFETLEWIKRVELAALASDTWGCEVRPNETEPGINQPWHWITIPIMGMTMGEIFYLKDLAEDCAADGVYEFMFVAPAIPITGAVGSPTNPLAIK